MDKKYIALGVVALLIIVIIIILIPKGSEPTRSVPEAPALDCTGLNDEYLHCVAMVQANDVFCDEQQWDYDSDENQKDIDFCKYNNRFKEALDTNDINKCIQIQNAQGFQNYDCADDYGCPIQPISCYIALTESRDQCAGLDQINVKGFTEEEKLFFCESVFDLMGDSTIEGSEYLTFIGEDEKNAILMLTAIKKQDPSICDFIPDTSRSHQSCKILTQPRDLQYCDQFRRCE